MVIRHISDTHGFHNMLNPDLFKDIDLVIHSGDATNHRSPVLNMNEMTDFISWFSKLPCKHKIYVAGNHDTCIEAGYVKEEDFRYAGIIYLEHTSTIIDGVNIFGTPFTRKFHNWAFNKTEEQLKLLWEEIPEDTNILISHGPPYGILDTYKDDNEGILLLGDPSLRKVCDRLIMLHTVCFGHIHDSVDITNTGIRMLSSNDTIIYSNAACVTDEKFDWGITFNGNILTVDYAKY
jgi:Icc-related predicted phosphoesterase